MLGSHGREHSAAELSDLCIVPFPLLHPPNVQRLGPTPAESGREGARHPSGLPQGWPCTYPCQSGRAPGWDHPAPHCPWAPLHAKAGIGSSQTVSWELARIKKPMYASSEPHRLNCCRVMSLCDRLEWRGRREGRGFIWVERGRRQGQGRPGEIWRKVRTVLTLQ